MKYHISFINKNGEEFMGTIRHFVTDGRYNFETIHDIAENTKNKLYDNGDIYGYVVRKYSFNNNIIKKVQF